MGFKRDMVRQGVLDFLEAPLVEVQWASKDGDIGNMMEIFVMVMGNRLNVEF
jgi:hypothetical protein